MEEEILDTCEIEPYAMLDEDEFAFIKSISTKLPKTRDLDSSTAIIVEISK